MLQLVSYFSQQAQFDFLVMPVSRLPLEHLQQMVSTTSNNIHNTHVYLSYITVCRFITLKNDFQHSSLGDYSAARNRDKVSSQSSAIIV